MVFSFVIYNQIDSMYNTFKYNFTNFTLDVNECVNPSFRYRRSLLVDTVEEPGTRSGRQKRYIYNYLTPSPTMSASSAIQGKISFKSV